MTTHVTMNNAEREARIRDLEAVVSRWLPFMSKVLPSVFERDEHREAAERIKERAYASATATPHQQSAPPIVAGPECGHCGLSTEEDETNPAFVAACAVADFWKDFEGSAAKHALCREWPLFTDALDALEIATRASALRKVRP